MKLLFQLLAAVTFTSGALAEAKLELGPMLGHVDSDKAQMWIKSHAEAKSGIVIGSKPDLSDGKSIPGPELTGKHDFMATIKVPGLAADQRYFYAIELNGKRITQAPYPSFQTPSKAATPSRLRIGFSSCLGRTGPDAAPTWAQVSKTTDLDLFLLLGDNHYADSTSRKPQSDAYFSHRGTPEYRAATSGLPIYSIWDDHDYGPNDSDGTAKGKEESLATFKDFWPNPSFGEADNPGIYYKFTRGEVDFFMLDVRYHRSPDRMIDDGTKTMLGAKQIAWLKNELKTSTAKVKIIASGSELQLNSHTDSWTSYPSERKAIFKFIEDEKITGILLVSGDRHFSGGYQIDGKLIEITAGPMGSKNYPSKNLPDMFLNQIEGKMFCVFDIDTTGAEPKVMVEVHRAGAGLVEKKELSWKVILGEEEIETLPLETTPKKHPYQKPFEP